MLTVNGIKWTIEQKFNHVRAELIGKWFVSREYNGCTVFGAFPNWNGDKQCVAVNPYFDLENEAIEYVRKAAPRIAWSDEYKCPVFLLDIASAANSSSTTENFI